MHHGAAGNDEFGADDVVARQSELRSQMTDPSSEREPGHAGRADDATGSDEAGRLRRGVEVEPGRSSLCLGGSRFAVDDHVAHGRKVDHETVVTDAMPGGVMAAAAHCDLEPVRAGEVERNPDVLHTRAAHDHRRPVVDERVEAAAGCVVPRVRGLDDTTGQRSPQLAEISSDVESHLRCLGLGLELRPVCVHRRRSARSEQ